MTLLSSVSLVSCVAPPARRAGAAARQVADVADIGPSAVGGLAPSHARAVSIAARR